jgi:hypothetical protein
MDMSLLALFQLVEWFYLSAAASEAHRVLVPLGHDKQGRCVQRSGAPPQRATHTDKTPDYQFITAATTWQSLLRVMFCAALLRTSATALGFPLLSLLRFS